MTRINLVPPSELTDQHLFAEFREIKMVPKSLARSLRASKARGETLLQFWQRIPKEFTLNTGHVSFFYNKGDYLRKRFYDICVELACRDVNFDTDSALDPDAVFYSLDHNFNNDYAPTPEALLIIRTRIGEKITMKPHWYRYFGTPLPQSRPWELARKIMCNLSFGKLGSNLAEHMVTGG